MSKLDVKKLGTNYSDKDPLDKGKKTSVVKVKKRKKKIKLASAESVSIYSGVLDGRSDKLLEGSVDSGGLVDELNLLKALTLEASKSKDPKTRGTIPNLIKTMGEIYEKIRKAVDGMRVVVSFKEAKFSRDVTENLANEIRDTLEAVSDNLCPECKVAFRSNLSRRIENTTDR